MVSVQRSIIDRNARAEICGTVSNSSRLNPRKVNGYLVLFDRSVISPYFFFWLDRA